MEARQETPESVYLRGHPGKRKISCNFADQAQNDLNEVQDRT
jgi:hypothetical protein